MCVVYKFKSGCMNMPTPNLLNLCNMKLKVIFFSTGLPLALQIDISCNIPSYQAGR